MTSTSDQIAANIKRVIAEKNLIQKGVAKRAGYTQQQLSDMLNGRKTIKAVDILIISQALEVEAGDLLKTHK